MNKNKNKTKKNVQNQQPKVEQRQQIRSERKLFRGIIKKEEMFSSAFNIVQLIILLPLMLIEELYYTIIDITLYLKKKNFFKLIEFSQIAILSVMRWIKKTYHSIVYLEYITQQIVKYTKLIIKGSYEIIKNILFKIISIIFLILQYVLDKLFIVIKICIKVYKKIKIFLSVKFIKRKIEKIIQYVDDIVNKLIIFVGCCVMFVIIYWFRGIKSVDKKILSLKKICNVLNFKEREKQN